MQECLLNQKVISSLPKNELKVESVKKIKKSTASKKACKLIEAKEET